MKAFPEYKSCNLCPRGCGIDRTIKQLGICNTTDDVRVARAALHFWEEPLISGDGGSGTIFLTGCSLQCVYCQNYKISRSDSADEGIRHNCTKVGTVMSAQELADKMLNLQTLGALNINFVTPTHFAPTIRHAVQIARDNGLHLPIVWNTSGYETAEAIKSNKGLVDVYLTDFKYADEYLANELSNAADYTQVAIDAIKTMLECVGTPNIDTYNRQERLRRGIIVRHLVLPGQVKNSIKAIRRLHSEFGESIILSIMNQYTPTINSRSDCLTTRENAILSKYPELARSLLEHEYEEVLCFADELYPDGYCYQEGDTCDESFIPEFK